MRSRYAAYASKQEDYLLATWHTRSRPQSLDLQRDTVDWLSLRIVRTEAGGPSDADGVVEFIACYRAQGRVHRLHEASHFVREQGLWFYRDGTPTVEKLGRNEPCPCGSGRKLKQCCGA